jgi:hypothetical protein
MKRIAPVLALLSLLALGSLTQGERAKADAQQLRGAFEQYSGARLVFDANELPPGQYHDVMNPLTDEEQVRAARIALHEVHKLPQGFLGAVGMKAIGIFQSCVSKSGDGFRPYDEKLKGYRYYGIWNGKDAVAAAFYSDRQLPLTLHHEVFHHVDGTLRGKTDVANLHHDEAFRDALSGKAPYPALKIAADDLAALKKACTGVVLETAVSDYCKKNIGEDKAETARFLMSSLPDGLVQMATRPELAGSQRMLHVLHKYETSLPNGGPGLQWFVDVALGRAAEAPAAAAAPSPAPATVDMTKPPVAKSRRVDAPSPAAEPPAKTVRGPKELLARLQAFANPGMTGYDGVRSRVSEARAVLEQAEKLQGAEVPKEDAAELVAAAAEVTHELLCQRIQPEPKEKQFKIWGREDSHGINQTLQDDIRTFGRDAQRLKKIAALAPESTDVLTKTQLKNLRLVAKYYTFIASNWSVSDGTRRVFDRAREDLIGALPEDQTNLIKALIAIDFKGLAEAIPPTGEPVLRGEIKSEAPPAKAPPAKAPTATKSLAGVAASGNPYISKVDALIEDSEVRAAIRRVQPACVRLPNGSGVNLAPEGRVLTNAHVAKKLGSKATATFPDGRRFECACVAIDFTLDLAIYALEDADKLPVAPVAPVSPEKGTRIVCIGQPGNYTPGGSPTGYQPFHVSAGSIRGILDNPAGDQHPLGRLKHDAWTYWGHSGSPLFNEAGEIVGMHNSWDSTTAMRHGVTHQAIMLFLKNQNAPYTVGN